MSEPVIKVEHLNKTFGTVRAVQDVGFEVDAGNCYGFLGPNGAGKTTVMKMIYGKCTRDSDHNCRMDISGHDPATDELAIK